MPLYFYRPDDPNTPTNGIALNPPTDTYEEPQTPFECLKRFRPPPIVSSREIPSKVTTDGETDLVKEAQKLWDTQGLKKAYFGYDVDLINNIFAALKSQANEERCNNLAEPHFLARWLNNDITTYDLSTNEVLDEEDQAGLVHFGPCAKANMWVGQKEHWKDSERPRGRWRRAPIKAAKAEAGSRRLPGSSQTDHSVQSSSLPSTCWQLQSHTLRAVLEVKSQALFPDWMMTVLHKILQYRSPTSPSTQGFYLQRDEGVEGVYGFHLSIPDATIQEAVRKALKNDGKNDLQIAVASFKRALVNLLCQLFLQADRNESEYLIFHNMSSTILLHRPDTSSPFKFTISPPIPPEGLGVPEVTLLTLLVALVGIAYDRETKRPGDGIASDDQRQTKKPRIEDNSNANHLGHNVAKNQVSSDNHLNEEIDQAVDFFPLSDLTFDERIFYPYPSLVRQASLSNSKTLHLSEPSSPPQPKPDQANFVLHNYVGLGALCKVYNGILHLPPTSSSPDLHTPVSPLPSDNTPNTTSHPTVIKVTDLYMFPEPPLFAHNRMLHDRSMTSFPPNRDQAHALVLNEAKIYQEVFSGSNVASEIVPQYYGLWTSHADGYKYEVMIQVMDEVGPAVAESWKTLDAQYVSRIERAFRALHSLGVIHGDIHPRHIRHCHHTAPSSIRSSRLMLIDFDRAKIATEEEIKEEWQSLQDAFNTWFPDRDVS